MITKIKIRNYVYNFISSIGTSRRTLVTGGYIHYRLDQYQVREDRAKDANDMPSK